MNIHEKLEAATAQLSTFRTAIDGVYRGRNDWNQVLAELLKAQDAIAKVRSAVRAKATAETRRRCDHSEDKWRVAEGMGGQRWCKCGKQLSKESVELAKKGQKV